MFPKWPPFSRQSKLKVFTACFYYVSHGNTTTTLGAVMKTPSENLELYNYLLRQTENVHDMKTMQTESPRHFDIFNLALTDFRKMF